MLKDHMRVCDVCEAEIEPGEKYFRNTLHAYAAAMLLENDNPALVPSFTQNADGTVNLDICQTCYLSMEPSDTETT
jgi:hypothetical protein